MMMDDLIFKCNTLSYDGLFFPHLCILQKHLLLISFFHQYSILIYVINHVPSTSNSVTILKYLYQGRNFGQDLSVLFVLLTEARLQSSHLFFKLGNGVFLVHVHRFQHLQLRTQLSIFQFPVFQMNLAHKNTKS